MKLPFAPQPDNREVGYWMGLVSNQIDEYRKAQFSPFELTPSQFDVLVFLGANDECEIYQVDIEKAFKKSNPTITGILNRLESKGLITRQAGKDKRYRHIMLTKKARVILEESLKQKETIEENILEGFSPKEKEDLVNYLIRISENLKKGKEQ